jgi:uncharacterized protein
MSDKELRIIRNPAEIRAAQGDDGGHVFTGYVFEWGADSEDLGGFVEVVRRGAAAAALKQPKNLFAILDHEKKVANVLGDRDSGTLDLFEDERGLGFKINAGPTQAAKDAAIVASRNRIGVSFAFICGKQNWTTRPDGTRQREILEFKELDDLSLVVDAAYKSSDVTVAKRCLEQAIEVEKREAVEAGAATVDFAPRLQRLLAILRGQHWLYFSSHWQASGPNFYGQHLMLERLYSGLHDEFDTLAEKMVAQYGEPVVAPGVILGLMAACVAQWSTESVPAMEGLVASENDLQATIRSLYDDMKAAGQLSAGLDDYLLSLANDHDTNAYLLGQASKPGDTPEAPTTAYLSRCLDLAERGVVFERRNDNHDEDGKFHGGKPHEMLSAAAGRMAKAHARHAAAVDSHLTAHTTNGPDHADTIAASEKRQQCRQAHAEAIEKAEAAVGDADKTHAAMVTQHMVAIREYRAQLDALTAAQAQTAPVM